MKVFPMLKKNALYITLAVLVALFVYYVYMNNYYEHATPNSSARVCALMTNTTSREKITVNVYAIDSDFAASPKYTGKKVLSTTIDANKAKTLKFTSGNYGFVVSVSNNSTDTVSTYTLTNLSLQKKKTTRNMWGRKRTSYVCSSEITKNTPGAETWSTSNPDNTPSITVDGISTKLGLITSGTNPGKSYSRLYLNTANGI